MKNNITTTIWSKLNDPIKYRVVFDVDDVLCCNPIELGSHLCNTKEEIDKRIQNYPKAIVIYWEYNGRTYLHFFYPDLDKLILSILSWGGWSIDFFSSGVKERNEEVIPAFLKCVLERYTDNVDKLYGQLIESGRCRIFSRQDMKKGVDSWSLEGFETFGQYKKDLTVVSEDTSNTILVENDRSYIIASQYPFIGISYSNASEFRSNLCETREFIERELILDPLKSPQYIMGILLSCKELLDSKDSNSLREALGLVLLHNINTLGEKNINTLGEKATPWFLSPAVDIYKYKNASNDSPIFAFVKQMNLWIGKAEEYWKSL